MGKVAFAEPAEQMTDEVLCGWDSRLYRNRGAKHIVRGPHPTSLRSATFPIGEGFWESLQLDKSPFVRESAQPDVATCRIVQILRFAQTTPRIACHPERSLADSKAQSKDLYDPWAA